MIVHHGQRWVYVGVPKTASTALHEYLIALGGVRLGRQHGMDVPPELRGYRVFATVMNPYRRAWSLWRMFCGDAAKGAPFAQHVPPEALASFAVFVEQVLGGAVETITLYRWTVHRWLAELPAGTEPIVLPVERLDAGLRRLGVIGRRERVPVRNITKGDWLAAYDERAVEAVRAWAAEDFRRFRYPTDLGAWRRRARLRRLARRGELLATRTLRGLQRLSGAAEGPR